MLPHLDLEQLLLNMAPLDSVFPSPLEINLRLRNIMFGMEDESEGELEDEGMSIFEEWSDVSIENWSGNVSDVDEEENVIDQEGTPPCCQNCLNVRRRLFSSASESESDLE